MDTSRVQAAIRAIDEYAERTRAQWDSSHPEYIKRENAFRSLLGLPPVRLYRGKRGKRAD